MAMLVICISAAHGDRGDGQHDGGTWDMMVEVLEKCVKDHGEHDVNYVYMVLVDTKEVGEQITYTQG